LRFGDLELGHGFGAAALVEIGGTQEEMGEVHLEPETVELDPLALGGIAADGLAHVPHDLVPSLAVVGVDAALEAVFVVRARAGRGEKQHERHDPAPRARARGLAPARVGHH